jgi:hypothetical protein
MIGDLVLTEHHTFGRQTAPHPVSLGSYGTDTHEIRRIVKDGVVAREGKTATGRGGAPPYPIGYAAIVPKAAECQNLFVTFALSASHTAFSSIRMEPVFMATSQSAATAAALAIDLQVPVQQVPYDRLRERLEADGQVLEWKPAGPEGSASATQDGLLPTVDLSEDTARHVIVAQGTEQVYQGHPTTLLMPDGKTMFCVWTYNHGGPCGPMKRSDDGGRTWSDLLPVPESWQRVRNCPAIYRLVDPTGRAPKMGQAPGIHAPEPVPFSAAPDIHDPEPVPFSAAPGVHASAPKMGQAPGVHAPEPGPFSAAPGVHASAPKMGQAPGVHAPEPVPFSAAPGIHAPEPVPFSAAPGIHDPEPVPFSRLFVFAGQGPDGTMHVSHSEDEGRTWSEMRSTGLVCVMPFCSIVPVDGGKRLLGLTNIRRPGETKDPRSNVVAQSESSDGGLTWSPWRILLDLGDLKPCEPAVVRSPDGGQLLCLLRENHKRIALFMTSDDEGRTWSEAKPLPPGLFGDRHMAQYALDGRLVVCFRDTGQASPTKDHFVAWVGRYEDIVAGRACEKTGVAPNRNGEIPGNPAVSKVPVPIFSPPRRDGQYRIKLLHSHRGSDCGYPGLERLPDGTFVATTYIKYRPGPEKHSVVSVRFALDETDAMAKGP